MTDKEKATRYDEAIERSKNYYSTTDSAADIKLIGLIFPELKESEDERIAKELLIFFRESMYGGHILTNKEYDSWLTWLEKQGKNNMGISEATKQKLKDNLNKALEKETPESWNEFLKNQGEQKLTPIFRIGDTIIAKDGTYIEKEPFHIDRIEDDCYWDGENTILVCNQEEFEIFEQKSIGKVEPKFKVGDIISNGISEAKIVSIDKTYYNVTNDEIENDANVCNWVVYFKNQDDWKLVEQKSYWGEEDERIYKVIVELLNSWSNGTIDGCIIPPNTDRYINWFKSLKNRVQPKREWSEDERIRQFFIQQVTETSDEIMSYRNMNKEDVLAWLEKQGEHANFRNKIQIGDKVTRNEDGVLVNLSQLKRVAKPVEPMIVGQEPLYDYTNANICQKDFAEQKPADKLEPKIKVKYAGCEYDVLEVKDTAGVTYYGIEDEPNHIDYVKADNCEIISGGYGIKENGSPYPTKPAVFSEQKTAWSEDDENMLKVAIESCEQCGNEYAYYWLKSLKNRVQPQQEWSEEDEILLKLSLENLTELKDRFGEYYGRVGSCIDWLKSLRPQNRWKPNEEEVNKIISIDQQVCAEWGISKYTKEHKEVIQEIIKRFIKS